MTAWGIAIVLAFVILWVWYALDNEDNGPRSS